MGTGQEQYINIDAQASDLITPTLKELFAEGTVRTYGTWGVRRISNKEEAIQYGRPEWCTGRVENNFYHLYTAGILLVFNKESKPRPQYQLYVSRSGSIEFRNGGNAYADFDGFCEKKTV